MNAKHTAGEWTYDETWSLIMCGNKEICAVHACSEKGSSRVSTEEARANARLIAAAPDGYAACKAVVEWAKTPGDHGGNPYCKEFVKLAEAALAKVEGGK